MREILASVDIGSNLVKLVVGELANGKVNILASACSLSKGVSKGFVDDPLELSKSLKEVFIKCSDIVGLKINNVLVSIPSEDASFFLSAGSVNIEPEQLIQEDDIKECIKNSITGRLETNMHVVSVMPTAYIIDDENSMKEKPIGKEATKLTVKTIVTSIPKNNIRNILEVFKKININVLDIVLAPIGDYYESNRKELDKTIGCFINIGYHTSTVSIFNKGILTNTLKLDYGSSSIIKDLSYVFKLDKNESIRLRDELCLASLDGVSASTKREYRTISGEVVNISEYEASNICYARILELLKMIKKEINHLTKKEIHYIMISGGVSEMENFSNTIEEVFGHSARILNMREVGARSNIYSTCVGMIKYYADILDKENETYSIWSEEEIKELSSVSKKISFNENSVLGKLFGYFFDN